MRAAYIFIIFIFITDFCLAQSFIKKKFPGTSVDLQFAGSVGLFSAGLSKISAREKVEVGFSLGHLPRNLGGSVQTINLKFCLNPLNYSLSQKSTIQPIQVGVFLSQSFGEKLSFGWSLKYPKGYYWWNSSLRYHLFFSTRFTYALNKSMIKKITCYFEANTNDLYIYSYVPNTKTIRIYDIFFLGIGTKLHLK
jgi:hypothetical protein